MSPLAQAARYIGVPYVLHGRDPAIGWDCWGCVAHVRAEVFGLPTPSWAEAYSAADAINRDAVERLIVERLGAWHEVEARPGAVALLTIHDRPFHVGLMLDRREMIHCIGGGQTVIEPVDRMWPAPKRRRGFYDCEGEAPGP